MKKPTETQRINIKVDPDKALMDTLDIMVSEWYKEPEPLKRLDIAFGMYNSIENLSSYVDTVKYHRYVQNRMYQG